MLNENVSLSGGLSYYNGGWRQNTKYLYRMNGATFVRDSAKVGNKVIREYFGVDAQVSIANNPLGITTLRGEYIQGQQPGTGTGSISPAAQPAGDVYIRNTSGGYFYFLQNILETPNQLVLKYDWYDPNTKVSGNEIGFAGSGTNAADVKYTTIGLGWVYRWNSHVKITAYYDIVKNETSSAPAAAEKNNTVKTWAKDRNDNVFTLRLQYKF